MKCFQFLGHLSPPGAEPALKVRRFEEVPSEKDSLAASGPKGWWSAEAMPLPVEADPVALQPGGELGPSLLQRLHEVLLDKRSKLGGTLPGTDGLLQRHQAGHIPLLHTHTQNDHFNS